VICPYLSIRSPIELEHMRRSVHAALAAAALLSLPLLMRTADCEASILCL
jgi:hypothetical protein